MSTQIVLEGNKCVGLKSARKRAVAEVEVLAPYCQPKSLKSRVDLQWKLSANNREPSTKEKRQKDCIRHSSHDEESIGQPKVILTNVLRTKIGRKYAQAQPKTGANFSDAGKLQSDQPPSSSAASLKICQILNPTLQSLFLPKRQPKVVLTNVLRTKIGRKYVDNYVTTDANLSDADKLQSGQLPSSSVASLQTCQILSSPHESSSVSE
ncbi:PREDICTED: sentrin-specific protease 7-like, partial [Tauraco erythrolophus]|uniref:sentrin-specific protease 7-like n=1 Tax=Tauraco erythrolophus TaxID=121530 RepID=UPI00052370C0